MIKGTRVGIFGGSFNPPHMGHLNSLQTVIKKAGLDEIRIVPAAANPLKVKVEGPSPEQRLEMTRLALSGWGDQFVVDDQEVLRGGKSYTIDTILNLRKQVDANDLYLILGIDQLQDFEKWKSVHKVITEANIIITSRPGFHFPQSPEELPPFLEKEVLEFDFNFIELKTGRNIQFIKLEDVVVSSTEVRKWIRIKKNVSKYIPLAVEKYIRENNIYASPGHRIKDYEKFTEFCANQLFSRKAIAVRGFDLRKIASPSEFTVVASGTSTRHASSLAENLMKAVKEEYNVYPQSVEGIQEGRWVVVDYGSLICHVFYDYVRQEYSIEKLWAEGKDLGLLDPDLKK
ncbi:MAG: ribosome silencing factor RsfS [Bdellovibrio sp. CG10_big_fil_rev_8_21_14_0_10_47_8]|nr:MAG: ribosome silencing factor RsfS [Bdellovibrio sp. CG10_big_fil_rev_8_21_14_0_10_47_8]